MKILLFLLLVSTKTFSSHYYELKTVASSSVAVKHNTLIVECILYCKKFDSFATVIEERKIFDDCYCVKEKDETNDDLNDFNTDIILKPINEMNLSQGRQSWHSSALMHMYSSRAFDGKWLTCQHTDSQLPNAWIKVGLTKPSVITRVEVYTAMLFGSKLKGAKIEVSSSFDMTQNYQVCAKMESTLYYQTFTCEKTTVGRYVRLSQQDYLNVCEMHVMGYYY